jgi:hypothetical protein
MAIDARIPLGIQPVQQQPNMLGQYAQIMAIKAAQQEIQGSDELRAAYASGGDLNDPEFRRRVMAANPKLGSELIKRNAETGKLQNESIAKRIEMSREMLTGVNTPEDYLMWHESNHKDPVLGGYLSQRGITAEQSRAKIMQELSKPGGLDKLKRESALGATNLAKELMQTERSRISAAPGHRQASVAEQRFEMEQDEAATIAKILGGGGGGAPPAPAPFSGGGGGGGVPMPAPAGGVEQPVTGAVTQPNVLAAQVAPTTAPAPNVNALNATPQIVDQISALIRTGKPKAIQAADALIKEYNIRNPAGKIEQDAGGNLIKVNERTGRAEPVIGPDGRPVMGGKAFESAYTKEVGEAAGKGDVALVANAQAAVGKLQDINQTLEQLKTSDAITGFGADILKDVERFRAQFTKDAKAGKRAADTEILNAMLGSEVFGMIQSLGIGARGLDTPAEREYLREVMTGTVRMDKAAIIRLTEIRKKVTERAIDEYNKKIDNGELNKYFETRGMTPRKIEKPSPASTGDISLDPAIQSLLDKYK